MLLTNKTQLFALASALLLTALPSLSAAQVGMAEDERSVVAIGGPGYVDEINGNGVIYHSGAWSLAPLSYSCSHHGPGPDNAYGDVSVSNYVDFGHLSVSASGDSESSDAAGTFTWACAYIGGDITTGFRDLITANENMDVSYTYTVDAANSILSNVDGNTGSSVQTLLQFANVNVGDSLTGNGLTTYTGTVHLLAGNTYSLLVGLGYNSSSNSNDLNTRYSSFSTSGTGTFSLKVLTEGATYTAASNHVYAVPEPLSILGLTLSLLTFSRRKRYVFQLASPARVN